MGQVLYFHTPLASFETQSGPAAVDTQNEYLKLVILRGDKLRELREARVELDQKSFEVSKLDRDLRDYERQVAAVQAAHPEWKTQ